MSYCFLLCDMDFNITRFQNKFLLMLAVTDATGFSDWYLKMIK